MNTGLVGPVKSRFRFLNTLNHQDISEIYGYIITLAPIFVRSTFVTNMFLCKSLTYRMLRKSCHNFRAVYLVNDVAFEPSTLWSNRTMKSS